jgi:hypothetical protein
MLSQKQDIRCCATYDFWDRIATAYAHNVFDQCVKVAKFNQIFYPKDCPKYDSEKCETIRCFLPTINHKNCGSKTTTDSSKTSDSVLWVIIGILFALVLIVFVSILIFVYFRNKTKESL